MSEGILPGGCLPQFPPEKFPPDEPDPDGFDDLTMAMDWETIRHEELFSMATEGLDLPGANAVAAKWADVAEQLRNIGADLQAAVTKSQHGWEGDSAELAQQTAAKLSTWAEDTSHRADEAGGCVSRQAEIAQRAANTMPEPVPTPEPPLLCGTPDVNQPKGPLGGTSAMSASAPTSPFTGGGFEQAGLLAEQPWERQEQARAAHRQAAEVMQKMQRESAEVYGTVPWFVPPRAGEDPYRRRERDDDDHRRRSDDPADTGTRTAGAGAAAGSASSLGAGGGGALGGPDASGRSQLTPGGQYGVGGPAAGGGAAAAAASAGAGGGAPRGGMGGMGAMPMGGMGAGGSRGEDEQRKGGSFLEGEKGIFDPDESPYEKLLGGEGDEDNRPPRRRR